MDVRKGISKIQRAGSVPEITSPEMAGIILLSAPNAFNMIPFQLTQLTQGRNHSKRAVLARTFCIAGTALMTIPELF